MRIRPSALFLFGASIIAGTSSVATAMKKPEGLLRNLLARRLDANDMAELPEAFAESVEGVSANLNANAMNNALIGSLSAMYEQQQQASALGMPKEKVAVPTSERLSKAQQRFAAKAATSASTISIPSSTTSASTSAEQQDSSTTAVVHDDIFEHEARDLLHAEAPNSNRLLPYEVEVPETPYDDIYGIWFVVFLGFAIALSDICDNSTPFSFLCPGIDSSFIEFVLWIFFSIGEIFIPIVIHFLLVLFGPGLSAIGMPPLTMQLDDEPLYGLIDLITGSQLNDTQVVDLGGDILGGIIEPLDELLFSLDDMGPSAEGFAEVLFNGIDNILIAIPTTLNEIFARFDLPFLCQLLDEISYFGTSFLRLFMRLITGQVLSSTDMDFILSIPARFEMCDYEPICILLTLLPAVPIVVKLYDASMPNAMTGATSAGFAALPITSVENLGVDRDLQTILQFVAELQGQGDIYNTTDGTELVDLARPFEEGLERLVYLESPLVDKSFLSLRFKTLEERCYRPEDLEDSDESADASGGRLRHRHLSYDEDEEEDSCAFEKPGVRTGYTEELSPTCAPEDIPESQAAFLGTGIENSNTCNAITGSSLNYLGSNCKIMTQIILDKMDNDKCLTDYLYHQYCNSEEWWYASEGGDDESSSGDSDEGDLLPPFLTRNEGCNARNMCKKVRHSNKDQGHYTRGNHKCRISDLPILKNIFMPDGNLPEYLSSRPDDFTDYYNVILETEPVTAIPTIFTLRHFGSNQMTVIDLLIVALRKHLVADGKGADSPDTIPKILFEILGGFTGGDLDGASIVDFLPFLVIDDVTNTLVHQFFLNDIADGASFPLLARKPYREFFNKLTVQPNASTPVEDYASVFATVPLYADIGKRITVVSEGTPYYNVHAYNSDHDLITLTLATYFGQDVSGVVVGGVMYSDIFDYIQTNIMEPAGVERDEWWFPGSTSPGMAPLVENDLVSLTIEPTLGIIRDLLPGDANGNDSILDIFPSPYAELLAQSQEYVTQYYDRSDEVTPWLGQGSCYMASDAWVKLYEDFYIHDFERATTPQGYTFREDGGEHVFATIGQNPRFGWSTLGECFNASAVDPSFTTVDNSSLYCQWGAYSGGGVEVTDVPTRDPNAPEGSRDVITLYKSNMMDIFGLSFKTFYMSILAQVALMQIFPLLEDEFPIFEPTLPPLDYDTVRDCKGRRRDRRELFFFGNVYVCDDLCEICDDVVPIACPNVGSDLSLYCGDWSFCSTQDYCDIGCCPTTTSPPTTPNPTTTVVPTTAETSTTGSTTAEPTTGGPATTGATTGGPATTGAATTGATTGGPATTGTTSSPNPCRGRRC